ncbi:MAG: hypothetical protein APG12_00595 [Candidatus Methanofastidiosum methylothiophilum]|uniref:DUF1003 domain-containing protein n=1 Tax=Candidatus Methanofastidiosum methylothiophilum TaxID=1705564 RepID=A0A150ISR5_9EURY|nr:MAG: hypothetical protein APG10_00544 [Candidatus Methanofastidiosum methylthiophilus]KYC47993.1 MAG: hypothetical protein APG11_00663 [Candidatus Methanofastidiosum methylthiophilus]KYC50683.1 MAG: hypothetical protein APG12_00595 [Candidatus Methanofastidiosum methylthiophilus]
MDDELRFPKPYKHDHEKVCNVNQLYEEKQTFGEKASDWATSKIGSWGFIFMQSIILIVWVSLNITAWINQWDPYPFIFLNLVVSLLASYTAPIIMMSQNRQDAKNRLEAHTDYLINLKAEEEIRVILENLEAQNKAISLIYQKISSIENSIDNKQ